ncbi:hypothetical protein D9M68_343130 [compost metagenome]
MTGNPLTSLEALLIMLSVLFLLILWALSANMRKGLTDKDRESRKAGIIGLTWCVAILWMGYAAAFQLEFDGSGARRAFITALATTVYVVVVFWQIRERLRTTDSQEM